MLFRYSPVRGACTSDFRFKAYKQHLTASHPITYPVFYFFPSLSSSFFFRSSFFIVEPSEDEEIGARREETKLLSITRFLDVMGFLEESLPIYPTDQHCSRWAREKMKFYLCGTKDAVSLSLGVLSVLSWGVAEIPQIITNYKEKSTEGLSLAFLMTWIVGDLFNLLGCKLEPATLPTQYYMAMLYTITTTLLTSQTIYYGHIYPRLKANRRVPPNKSPNQSKTVDKVKSKNDALGGSFTNGSDILDGGRRPSLPVPVASPILSCYGSLGRDMYYMSARSLTKASTPTAGSYLASRSCERTGISPIRDPEAVEEPLLGGHVAAQSAPPVNTKSMLCAISAVTFFVSRLDLKFSVNNRLNIVLEKTGRGVVIKVGRKLLQDNVGERNIEIGTILGWAMAAIYMGGRLPQICLNIRRGNVEGLNPLMFIFALLGNITYVGSILVSSMAWSKIRPNLPWLVDAGGCILLDTFILIQFIYFHRLRKHKDSKNKHGPSLLPKLTASALRLTLLSKVDEIFHILRKLSAC